MLKRTVTGLSMSIRLGLITAVISSVTALLLGTASALFGKDGGSDDFRIDRRHDGDSAYASSDFNFICLP